MTDRRSFLAGVAGAGALALVGCRSGGPRVAPSASPSQARTGPVVPRVAGTIATGLNVPWGIAFLPDGRALVGQRDRGVIVLVDPKAKESERIREVGTVPGVFAEVSASRGLLGMALDPDDATQLYVFFTTVSDQRIVRIDVKNGKLGEIEPILTGIPTGKGHYGGRIAFGPDGFLYASAGDNQRVPSPAQDRDSLAGKILRITKDGKPVKGNPFDSEVWSWGHRNIEGIAFDADGRLWSTEFGADKADELNLIEKGGNYGWPLYEGASDDPKYVAPKVTWPVADCSPAGIAIARSTAFVAGLRGGRLWAIPLHAEKVGKPRDYFVGKYGRLRTVATAPDGSLWLGTSNTDGNGKPRPGDDRLLRIVLE
ncbi:MAG TPA: PQQ-dependent sugar dehydrogenase [Aeromicrobium sp.]|nr:PQQ-dependent sugar dehydrogenase [Aeromicrobium sp.]